MTKFHINAEGVPAPCRAREGNCPYGGDTGKEHHFDTIEEAQEYVDEEGERNHGLLPLSSESLVSSHYAGKYIQINKHADDNMKTKMDGYNTGYILDKGFEGGDIYLKLEDISPKNDEPIKLDVEISRVGEGKYSVVGGMSEHLSSERDFDSSEEFGEYIKGDPDGIYDVDFEFTTRQLEQALESRSQLGRRHEAQVPSTIMYGVYILTKERK